MDRLVPVDELKTHPKTRNKHPAEQIARLAEILKFQGWRYPVKVSNRSGFVTSGHGRIEAARLNGWVDVPVNFQDYDSDEQEYADVQSDNAIASWAELDLAGINSDLGDLGPDFDIDLLGIKDFVLEPAGSGTGEPGSQSLSDRFGAPPFSVLDSRQGYWQDRKRGWLSLGIKSEIGRDDNLMGSQKIRDGTQTGFSHIAPTTSVFDPVLCELAYRWFSAAGATIIDPFAGGSVRGVVASKLNRQYVGIELRAEQVTANRDQAQEMCADPMPVWHCGDSTDISTHAKGVSADLLFSCPPYADLEVYSDDPRDLSNMSYEQFLSCFRHIIKSSVELLKPDRFACFVVGDIRDKSGRYRNFVSDTIAAFKAAGADLYNEAILVTQFGTVAMTAPRAFAATRKLGKTHQNVLIFCKGDPKRAAQACGEVEAVDMSVLGEAELPQSDGVAAGE